MAVTLNLTSSQRAVFEKVTKLAKVKNLFYENNQPQITKENISKVSDAVEAAYYKEIKESGSDEENLRIIAERLNKLWPFFDPLEEELETEVPEDMTTLTNKIDEITKDDDSNV